MTPRPWGFVVPEWDPPAGSPCTGVPRSTRRRRARNAPGTAGEDGLRVTTVARLHNQRNRLARIIATRRWHPVGPPASADGTRGRRSCRPAVRFRPLATIKINNLQLVLNRRTQIGAVRSGHFQSPLMPGRQDQASTPLVDLVSNPPEMMAHPRSVIVFRQCALGK